ncbi:hypothetical protein HELRODRAFT_108526 [Helobdella robusta]|uniref:RNA helicase n=1 Tax=Helobdella robusta TaxID=6412 RepID=T1EEJ8_HELRO|nr:hypothetical protein HELRODRAFT_108526 [Helobdella robusta]ESN91783.1 hypothetical protein HELRODRAFT_108526 [Helobdella robusta]
MRTHFLLANNAGVDGKKPPTTYVPPEQTLDENQMFESICKGINFDKYEDIPVDCTGQNPPQNPISSFEDCAIHATLKSNVVKAKYDRPTPIQKWSIPTILLGRDLMACAQTGSGKTAGFLLPVLTGMLERGIEGSPFTELQEPQAIVIGPTRELVAQIYKEAYKFSLNTRIRPVVVYGGVSVSHQLHEIEKGAHIVIATPGRLIDFINREKIGLSKVKYLVLDEADRMLDMGFKDDITKICCRMGMPDKFNRQTLMFSATFPSEIQQIAHQLLNDYIFITVGMVGGANQDIIQNIELVENKEKQEKLLSILKNQNSEERTLIFVEKKKMTDFLALVLCQHNLPATSIHGDREQREREEALAYFKSGKTPILVATSVASRGLDIPGVNHVINYDLPASIDEYVHRIGRTGRCGNIGQATSFFNPSNDSQLARPLVKILSEASQEVPHWLEEQSGLSSGLGGFEGQSEERVDLRKNGNIQIADSTKEQSIFPSNNFEAPSGDFGVEESWE